MAAVTEAQITVPVIIDWSKVDWRRMQVKAIALNGKKVVGYLNRHAGDPECDVCGNVIKDGDFYIFDWKKNVALGFYGVNYAVHQDSIGIAPAEECL